MLECPIDYFIDNLIFNRDKSCWAIYELKGYEYENISDESKLVILNKLTLFIASTVSEAKYMIIPVSQDLDTQFNLFKKELKKNDPLYDNAIFQADATKKYLSQKIAINGRSNDYKTYVAVKLVSDSSFEIVNQIKDMFDFMVKSVVNDINAFFHTDVKDILKSKIKHFKKLASLFLDNQNKRLALMEIDTKTTQWLIRRMMYRGLPKEVKLYYRNKQENWTPRGREITLANEKYLRPRKRDITNLFSGVIKKSGRTLIIEHETDISYQTFLVITNIPNEMMFPGYEYIYLLQQYNIQAEIYIHTKNIEHREALRKIDFQRRAIKSQMGNIDKADEEIPEELFISKEESEALEAELKSSKFPITQTSLIICLADKDQDELNKKANFIKTEYEDMNFIVERPFSDQFELFMQCIPSVGFVVKDFIKPLTPTTLASGVIGATHELGDLTGSYIGTTGEQEKNVFLDMRLACLTNKSASATFYGNLGFGKSFNANLLVYLHVLNGAYGLIIDPKGERSHWVSNLPGLKGHITLVTLTSDPRFKGSLDPYNIFRDVQSGIYLANELTLNVLTEMFKLQPKDDEYTALQEALGTMKYEQIPSMTKLIKKLENFNPTDDLRKDALKISRKIKLLSNGGMGQLLIGDGNEKAIQLGNRLNILQIENLTLPEQSKRKDDYTPDEVISVVLMMVMTAFVKRFIHGHKNRFKICLFDESWMLGKTSEGEALMSYFGRMSRSLYAAMILNGHSVTDLPNEGIRNAITYKFCFHTDSRSEADRMLDYLNLEKTKSNFHLIMNLKNAECLFQDLNGRVGKLKFDAVFQDLIDVFSTTPEESKEEKDTSNAQSNDLNEPDDTDKQLIETPQQEQEIDIFAYED